MIQRLSFALLLLLLPGLVNALGLGKLELRSNLNEPFEARINLISPTVDELASLNILLADQDAFHRAGIQRAAVLRHLRFTVVEPDSGPDYIRIFSDEPIREPFLNFLLELNWSKGRLFREYTVLLDPPIYAAKQQRLKSLEPETPKPAVSDEPRAIEDNRVVYNPEYTPPSPPTVSPAAPAPAPASPIDYTGGDYGPVEAGNTLWSIASAMRPDTSVSVQQMMLALLRANPEAFINNNINGLKRGQVLRMPDLENIRQVSKADAFAEAKQQNLAWQGVAPAAPMARAEGAPAAEPDDVSGTEAADAGPAAEGDAELRLVAAAEEGEGVAGGEPTTDELNQELALVNESLEALKQENLELQDKLIESEAIIDDLKRLIVLKEEELATLQQQIATREAEIAAAEAESMAAAEETMAETPAEPTEEAMAPEETMEEEMMEPAATEEMAEEEPATDAEATGEEAVTGPEVPEEEPVAEVSLLDKVKGFFSGLIPESLVSNLTGMVKGNLALVGGSLGGLLLLILGGVYFKRRQADKATEIPASEFPEFDDMDDTVAADTETDAGEATDINPALSESEDATESPASDEEGLGEFDLTAEAEEEEKTQVVSPEAVDEFEATTTEKPAAAAEAEDEEDRLAEVNVFLAYEHFDQAADFVKDAIAEQPDNLEFHSKLLEVYYAAGDKKNYEEAARFLHDKVDGEGEYWDMAVAMWQELSPNRALFEAPAAGEEEEEAGARTEGGGIVNIAGDEETAASSTGLDFDLDTTSGTGQEEEEPATEDEEADVLDVTAAVGEEDKEEDEVLDLTSAEEEESDALDFSFDDAAEEAASEKKETATDMEEETGESGLDISLGETDDNALDFSLDETGDTSGTEAEDEGVEASLSDSESDSLDFSIGGDDDTAGSESDQEEGGLDVSAGDTGESRDSSLDFSVHAEAESADSEDEEDLDISVSDTGESDDSSLDLSVDESGSADEESGEGLDISLGDTGESDDSSLDLSVDEAGSAGEGGEEGLDISLGDTGESDDSSLDFSVSGTETEQSQPSGHDPLDVTSSVSGEEGEESEDILDLSKKKDEDLLDVTSSVSYEPEGDEELLDVTSATGAGIDSDEQIEVDTDEEDSAKTGEDSGIDFDNGSMDRDAESGDSVELDISVPESESDESDDELTLDVTGGTEGEESGTGLDLEFGDEGEESDSGDTSEIDMDATMEIPKSSTATDNKLELEAEDTSGTDEGTDTSGFDLEIDSEEEEGDGEDQTVFVGRSADTEEQSDEDEIATQLDLAKAYIELGDTDNARTILNEIISVGNDQQRQQAEELLSQV